MKRLSRFRQAQGLERWERWTEWPLLILGLVFIISTLLPLARPLARQTQDLLEAINWFLWAAFAIDYVVRLWLALDRRHFVKTHILDLIIVLVPPFRLLRLVRLVSVFVVFLRRARDLPYLVLPLYVAAITALLIGVSAVLVYDAEGSDPSGPITTLGDAVWWAFTTVTTVGYGDEYPVTPIGRALGVVLMLAGITLLGSLTASAAAWLTNSRRSSKEQVELEDLMTEITALRQEVRDLRKDGGPVPTIGPEVS
jgi:voltage-gated potassium channel